MYQESWRSLGRKEHTGGVLLLELKGGFYLLAHAFGDLGQHDELCVPIYIMFIGIQYQYQRQLGTAYEFQ